MKKSFSLSNIFAVEPPVVVLLILDGWGIAESGSGNAISRAETPVMHSLVTKYPTLSLRATGEAVGLPWGEIGNSEAGHFALGTGRPMQRHLLRINKDIWDGKFMSNKALVGAVNHARRNDSALHLVGMLSAGQTHSYVDHLYALLDIAKQHKLKKVFIHCILDGRDSLYNSGLSLVKHLEDRLRSLRLGQIATLHGRYYAMDRDRHWSRTKLAYQAIVQGQAKHKFLSATAAINYFYEQKIYDEYLPPVVVTDKNNSPLSKVGDSDAMIFFNFRADRAKQLASALVDNQFTGFIRQPVSKNIYFVSFINYGDNLKMKIAWSETVEVKKTLAAVIADKGWKQLHIAETEKYALVTHFFNGGKDELLPGEDQVLIPSLPITNYDERPEMSIKEITKRVITAIVKNEHRFVVVNFANADMVAHTANLKATIAALETIDEQIGLLVKEVLDKDGLMFITADHGNAESLINAETGSLHKEHTANPVPFIMIRRDFEGKTLGLPEAPNGDLSLLSPAGSLCDVAPTILKFCHLKKPREMTGRFLI